MVIVVRAGYGFVFKPLPLSQVLTWKGVSQYISLAIPGLFQNAFEWIIQEVAVILAGYVTNSTIALSATVILANLMYLVMAFMAGIAVCFMYMHTLTLSLWQLSDEYVIWNIFPPDISI